MKRTSGRTRSSHQDTFSSRALRELTFQVAIRMSACPRDKSSTRFQGHGATKTRARHHLPERRVTARIKKRIAKAAARDVAEDDFPKLVQTDGARPTIRDNPPLIYHRRRDDPEYEVGVEKALVGYRESLQADRRALLDRYRLQDTAVKVVGIGSVGTMCVVALLMADAKDPLFLQVKEARRSVLEPYAGASVYPHRGQRVVEGRRLMQAASDLFLGWTTGPEGRHFYVRQLRDMKIKPVVERFTPAITRQYAKLCGWGLARAHARSGQAAIISGYLGQSDRFERAVTDFAVAYADQNARDHEALQRAVREGRIHAGGASTSSPRGVDHRALLRN